MSIDIPELHLPLRLETFVVIVNRYDRFVRVISFQVLVMLSFFGLQSWWIIFDGAAVWVRVPGRPSAPLQRAAVQQRQQQLMQGLPALGTWGAV